MIFYFSATGNSLYAAQQLAATGETLVSIGTALREGQFCYDISGEERLGFVLPTFAWTLPGAVALFLDKLQLTGLSNPYVYGVFTCGESTGNEAQALGALLREKRITLSATYDLVMPDNFIIWSDVPSPVRLEGILAHADKTLQGIAEAVTAKKLCPPSAGTPKDLHMPLETISTEKGTSKFTADEGCTGCGLCETLCPMRCIRLDAKNRPLWEGTCTMCLACLHRCPAHAIQHGNDTQKKSRYVNPHVTL